MRKININEVDGSWTDKEMCVDENFNKKKLLLIYT